MSLQERLDRAIVEIRCLKARRKIDKKILRAHQSKAFFLEEGAEQDTLSADVCPAKVQSTAALGDAGTAALELSAARLEVDLSHRALALLRLRLESAREDIDQLKVASCLLREEYQQEAQAAENARQHISRLQGELKQQQALEAQLQAQLQDAEARLAASQAAGEDAVAAAQAAAAKDLAEYRSQAAAQQAERDGAATEQVNAAEKRAAAASERAQLAEERLASAQERAQIAEVRLQERGSLQVERAKLADERASLTQGLSQDRVKAAEERIALAEAAMQDKVKAAEQQAARAVERQRNTEERVARLEAELSAAAEAAAAEARASQRQVTSRDRHIATLEAELRTRDVQGTPRRSVECALGTVSDIVEDLRVPSSTKPAARRRAEARSPLATVDERDHQSEAAAAAASHEPPHAASSAAQQASTVAAAAAADEPAAGKEPPKRKAKAATKPKGGAAKAKVTKAAKPRSRPQKRSADTDPETEDEDGGASARKPAKRSCRESAAAPAAAATAEEQTDAAETAEQPAGEGRKQAAGKRSEPQPDWLCTTTPPQKEAAGPATKSTDPPSQPMANEAAAAAAAEAEAEAGAATMDAAPVDIHKTDEESAKPAEPHAAAAAADKAAAAYDGEDSQSKQLPAAETQGGEGAKKKVTKAKTKPKPPRSVARPQGVARIDLNSVWGNVDKDSSTHENSTKSDKENSQPVADTRKDPLAALNPGVLKAAAARNTAGLGVKAAYQKSWATSSQGGNALGKRKLLKPVVNTFAGTNVPDSMLFGGDFKIPKLLSNR